MVVQVLGAALAPGGIGSPVRSATTSDQEHNAHRGSASDRHCPAAAVGCVRTGSNLGTQLERKLSIADANTSSYSPLEAVQATLVAVPSHRVDRSDCPRRSTPTSAETFASIRMYIPPEARVTVPVTVGRSPAARTLRDRGSRRDGIGGGRGPMIGRPQLIAAAQGGDAPQHDRHPEFQLPDDDSRRRVLERFLATFHSRTGP